MTLTVRSAAVTGATTKGSALTHAEMDGNFAHLSQADGISFAQSGSGASSITAQTKLRQSVHVDDFGAVGDGSTDDSTAIQNALNTSAGIVEMGPKVYNVGSTGLTLKYRQKLVGKGRRVTTISYSGTGTAVAVETGSSQPGADITEHGGGLQDLAIKCTAQNGSGFTNYTAIASVMELRNLLIQNTHASGASGTNVGMTFNGNTDDAGSGNYAGYWNKCRMVEVRGFNVGVRGKNNANDFEIDGLILDCATAFELESVSGWLIKASIETAVSNAIGVYLAKTAGKTSTNIVIQSQRFEMTSGTPEAIKFGAGTTTNVVVVAPYELLNGSPNIFSGTVPSSVALIRGSGRIETRNGIRVDGDILHSHSDADVVHISGGTGLSTDNGAILSLYGASEGSTPGEINFSLANDKKLRVFAGGSSRLDVEGNATTSKVTILGASGATGYQHPLYLGGFALWVDSNGDLLIKNGTPTSDSDGTVVGTQT